MSSFTLFVLLGVCCIFVTAKEEMVEKRHIPTFSVKTKNDVCLLLQTNLRMKIPHFTKSGQQTHSEFVIKYADVPKRVNSSGICGEYSIPFNISWTPKYHDYTTTIPWNITVQFKKLINDYNKKYEKDDANFAATNINFEFYMDAKLFTNSNETNVARKVFNEHMNFKCPVDSYFHCDESQALPLSGKRTSVTSVNDAAHQLDVSLIVDHFRVQAFRSVENMKFTGKEVLCIVEGTRVLPIIVGVTLAIMIVGALGIFFIGSHRRQRAYERI